MRIEIVGSFDKNKVYCAGSFTKFLTTFVTLSFLSEKYSIASIVDDVNFFDSLCNNATSKEFLEIFKKHVKSSFSLRDICSYYSGLPYTFDASPEEIKKADQGFPFKHHSILDEATFIKYCKKYVTPIYPNRCKFHYSEVGIIFLGYFIESVFRLKMEELYQNTLLKNLICSTAHLRAVALIMRILKIYLINMIIRP